MRVEWHYSMRILSKPLFHGVARGNLVVFEGVHFIQVNVSVKVLVGKLCEVDLADVVLDVGPFEGISGL